jgi:hypothetical protein
VLHKILTAVTALAVVASLLAGAAGQAAAVTGYDSAYFGESAFLTLGPSQTGQFAVGFNNTGSTGWLTGSTSQVDLTVCLSDKTTCNTTSPNAAFATNWLSSTAYSTTSTTYVGPGQTGYFVYNVTVPSNQAPGLYRFNGDLSLHGTSSMIHPEGYYQDVQVPNVGAPAKLACSLTPTTLESGSTQTANLTVTVVDAAGTPVTTQNTFSITAYQAGTTSTIEAPNPTTVVNGVAHFIIDAPASGVTGTDQLSAAGTPATPAAVLQGCLANLTFAAPGAPTQLAITAPTQTQYPAGAATSTTATATFRDAAGVNTTTTAASTTVTFSVDNSTVCYITATAGTTSANVVVAAGAGSASIPFTMTGVPGSCTLTAASTGLTSGSKTYTAISAGPAAQVAITANTCVNTPTTSNTAGSTCAVTVQVQDAAGNPVFANNSVTLSLTKSGSTCAATFVAPSVPAGTQTAAPNATATASTGAGSTVKYTLQDAIAETCTATATSGLLTSASGSVSFTGFGPANNLTLRPTAQSIPANGVAQATLTACVRDVAGNIVTSATGDTVLLTVAVGGDGTNTTVVSANPTTTASGCAAFTVQSTTVAGTDTYTAVDTTRSFTSNGATIWATP